MMNNVLIGIKIAEINRKTLHQAEIVCWKEKKEVIRQSRIMGCIKASLTYPLVITSIGATNPLIQDRLLVFPNDTVA